MEICVTSSVLVTMPGERACAIIKLKDLTWHRKVMYKMLERDPWNVVATSTTSRRHRMITTKLETSDIGNRSDKEGC